MQKIKVYHFHNGGGGGVLSVIRNLFKFSGNPGIENHIVYTINKDANPEFTIEKTEGATSENIFYYSPDWNFYYTCKQLAKLLPGKAVVVAHDWLELGMISNLGLQNPVVQFVHGNYEYYYELAKKHEQITDQFLTISPIIYNNLNLLLPHRKQDIHFRRFPVPPVESILKENKILKIFYCVRNLTENNKQFNVLPLINQELQSRGINVLWTIIGDGIDAMDIKSIMHQEEEITVYSSLSNAEVLKLLPGHDLFVLPSIKEGFPVSVVEAMKAGVVPLVTNWEDATNELIIPGETGYYFTPGDMNGYADTIALLNESRELLKDLSFKATQKANELFDPYMNTRNIEAIIIKSYESETKPKIPGKVYGSRLDQAWIPNIITKTIRSI